MVPVKTVSIIRQNNEYKPKGILLTSVEYLKISTLKPDMSGFFNKITV